MSIIDVAVKNLIDLFKNDIYVALANALTIYSGLLGLSVALYHIYNKNKITIVVIHGLNYTLLRLEAFFMALLPVIQYLFYSFIIFYIDNVKIEKQVDIINLVLLSYSLLFFFIIVFYLIFSHYKNRMNTIVDTIKEKNIEKDEFKRIGIIAKVIIPIIIIVYVAVFSTTFWLIGFKVIHTIQEDSINMLIYSWIAMICITVLLCLLNNNNLYIIPKYSIMLNFEEKHKCCMNVIVNLKKKIRLEDEHIVIYDKYTEIKIHVNQIKNYVGIKKEYKFYLEQKNTTSNNT